MAAPRKIKGRYYARFHDRTRTPKRTTWPLKTSRKDVAWRKYIKLKAAFDAGEFDPWLKDGSDAMPSKLTLAQTAERFKATKAHLRPKTQEVYETALNGLQRCTPPGLMIGHLHAEHLRAYVLASGVSDATQRHRFRVLRTFCKWCVSEGLLKTNPVQDINTLPKEGKSLPQFLTSTQVDALVACIGRDYGEKRATGYVQEGKIIWLVPLIRVAVHTGLRRGELAALRWSDVDFQAEHVQVRNRKDFKTKSGSERAVPLSSEARTVLRRLHAERKLDIGGYVFTGHDGQPLNPSRASKRFKFYARECGFPEEITFHSLRHTFASWLVQRGVPLNTVRELMGHADIETTQIYAHLAPDNMQAAIRQAFG